MTMQDRLQAMIDAGQDAPLARFTLGELLYKNGELETACTHLAEAVRQDPEYSAAWRLYGRVLLDADRVHAAIDALERGVEVAERRGDNQAAKEMQVFLKRARRAQN
ncbi:tetratricopeptide repeat protein [Salinisphaera sp. LB1]|uniref:tetratricopeptide repeat protein n=1 Tax=Salinisphaera sp. LB1 TaxID=2183911 RepID=UPI000D708C7A|nr:tetratricopeptide repeat protein [Salinisphaera sp. LB1]